MTEVIRVGPYDRYKAPKDPGYSEQRGIGLIEQGLRRSRMPFNFRNHLGEVADRFKGGLLNILEGGCGEAQALADLKVLGSELGIEMHTTGITMARRNIRPATRNGVDILIVGRLERSFSMGKFENKFNFILDWNGAFLYDIVGVKDRFFRGSRIAPIYSQIMEDGGTALLLIGPPRNWHGVWSDHRGRLLQEETHDKTLSRLEEIGLRVILEEPGYALVEK